MLQAIGVQIMNKSKRSHSAVFKHKVAVAAIKQELSQSQISARYEIHTSQINKWKKEALQHIEEGFSNKRERQTKENSQIIDDLYKQIGRLKMELEWLKKKSGIED